MSCPRTVEHVRKLRIKLLPFCLTDNYVNISANKTDYDSENIQAEGFAMAPLVLNIHNIENLLTGRKGPNYLTEMTKKLALKCLQALMGVYRIANVQGAHFYTFKVTNESM